MTQTNKDKRNAQMTARRKARVAWLTAYLTSQDCERCQRPVKQHTVWHHRDPFYDHMESDRNLSTVRTMAQQGYAQATIEAELRNLMPLCRACYANLDRGYLGPPELTRRQLYERTRYAADGKGNSKRDYMRQRREERLDWLATHLDKPCEQCGATASATTVITWHHRIPALDQKTEAKTLATLRLLANTGAAYARLEAEYANLIPLCAICQSQRDEDLD